MVGELDMAENCIFLSIPILDWRIQQIVPNNVISFSILVLPDLEIVHNLEVDHEISVITTEGHEVDCHSINITFIFVSFIDARANDVKMPRI